MLRDSLFEVNATSLTILVPWTHEKSAPLTTSALGLGCWAIGGPFGRDGASAGWGDVDDDQSVAAIRRGLELGVTLFDTADVYGTGHSETILGRALGAERDDVAIATKFGNTFEEGTGRMLGADASPAYIRRACEASLRRLGTDRIDLYQCHLGDLEPAAADEAAGALEGLRDDGLIRAYGWSLDDAGARRRSGPAVAGFASVQHHLNVLEDAPEMLDLCERAGIASDQPRAAGDGPAERQVQRGQPAARATTSAAPAPTG